MSEPVMTREQAQFLLALASEQDRAIYSVADDTDPAMLAVLAESEDFACRTNVAGNPNTSHEVLKRLAADCDFSVRIAVVFNDAADPAVRRRADIDDHTHEYGEPAVWQAI